MAQVSPTVDRHLGYECTQDYLCELLASLACPVRLTLLVWAVYICLYQSVCFNRSATDVPFLGEV